MTCTAQESSSPLIYRKKNENKEGKETLLKKKKHEELHRFILFPQSVQRRLQEPFLRRPPQRSLGHRKANPILSVESCVSPSLDPIPATPIPRRSSESGGLSPSPGVHFWPGEPGVGIWCRGLLLSPVDAWLAEETAAVPCCSAWME